MKIFQKILSTFLAAFCTFSIVACDNGENACGENTCFHIYASEITKEATCAEKGIKTYTCGFCGDSYTEDSAAKGHEFVDWEIIKTVSCEFDGKRTRSCTCCGEIETETIKATGHNWVDATCYTAKKCLQCQKTVGNPLGHNKGTDGYCTRCKEKLEIDMNTVVGSPNECSTISYFGFCFYKNSVNGIKVCWGGENLSGKTINYYTITLYFYNSVGDPAYSEITGKSSKTVKYVGPVDPGADLIIFGIVDYVPVCSKIVIGEIMLEYSDGTSDTGWYGWSTTKINSALNKRFDLGWLRGTSKKG